MNPADVACSPAMIPEFLGTTGNRTGDVELVRGHMATEERALVNS